MLYRDTPRPDDLLAMTSATGSTLLDKLDAALRQRADDMIDNAMRSIVPHVAEPIRKALATTAGGGSAAVMAEIDLRIGDAIADIARAARERAYQTLAEQAIARIATGDDFNLSN